MIAKSYEIKNRISNFLKYNLFLFYGENDGLKKDIVESIKSEMALIADVEMYPSWDCAKCNRGNVADFLSG